MQSAQLQTFDDRAPTSIASANATERTEYHAAIAWDRLAEICAQFLGKGQLVDVEGRLQTRQWDDDAGKRHWKTEIVVNSLEMLSGRGKKEYAKQAQEADDEAVPRTPMAPPRSRSRRSSRCSQGPAVARGGRPEAGMSSPGLPGPAIRPTM